MNKAAAKPATKLEEMPNDISDRLTSVQLRSVKAVQKKYGVSARDAFKIWNDARDLKAAKTAAARAGKKPVRGAFVADYIMERGDPIDFLIGVMNGHAFSQPDALIDPATGAKPIEYPTKTERIEAAKLLIPRVSAQIKPVGAPINVQIDAINGPADILKAINSTMRKMGKGEITHDDAKAVLDLIDKARAAIDTDVLASEVAELKALFEQKHG